MNKIFKLIISVSVCLLTGLMGSITTMDSIKTWYTELSRPSFTPPDWTFGVVWPILYIMMGLSAFLIWTSQAEKRSVKMALYIFSFQLLLNGLWTPLFFGLHMIGLALAEIILLWAAIFLTIRSFWKISRAASVLLIPYLLWVSFAVILNAGFLWLNR